MSMIAQPDAKQHKRLEDLAAELHALGHVIRIRAILMLDDSKKALSPNEMANEAGVTLGRMSYHVRVMHDAKLIHLASTKPRRGAVEHFYRLSPKGESLVARLRYLLDQTSVIA